LSFGKDCANIGHDPLANEENDDLEGKTRIVDNKPTNHQSRVAKHTAKDKGRGQRIPDSRYNRSFDSFAKCLTKRPHNAKNELKGHSFLAHRTLLHRGLCNAMFANNLIDK